MYQSKVWGNSIGFSHASVKHGWHFFRVIGHLLHGRICLRYSQGGDNRSKSWEIQIGPGAGYVSGLTLFLGWNCKDRQKHYRYKRLQCGITRNANKVPYVSG